MDRWVDCATILLELRVTCRRLRLGAELRVSFNSCSKPELARNLTEKFLAYALCRQLEGYDQIVVDNLMETIAKDDYRM